MGSSWVSFDLTCSALRCVLIVGGFSFVRFEEDVAFTNVERVAARGFERDVVASPPPPKVEELVQALWSGMRDRLVFWLVLPGL